MYQQRRLGALGIERRYSSVNFSVGPVDVNSIQDYQMLPLPDLDRIIEPLPEFLDAIDWEPEIEVQSEDNDSEYNVTDDPSEGEQGSLGTIFSGDSECSAEDSEGEHSLKDGLRRSKRKKRKEEVMPPYSQVEFMTSSGRRVKRKNLDECDDSSSRINRMRKARKGKKSLKRKPSRSKSLRPQRVAARNARNFLSRINGVCTDEDVDNSEDESSDGESILAESDFQSNESDRSIENLQQKNPKGKEVSLDEAVKASELQCQTNARNKKKLILKLPGRDSNMVFPTDYSRTEEEEKVCLDSLYEAQENIELSKNHFSLQGPGSSSGNLFDPVLSQNEGEGLSSVREQTVKVEDYLDLSTSYQDNNIKWGEVKVRTSKRLRHGDVNIGSSMNEQKEIRNSVNGHCKPESEYGIESTHSETLLNGDEPDRKAYNEGQQCRDGTSNGASDNYTTSPDNVHQLPQAEHQKNLEESPLIFNSNFSTERKDQSGSRECTDYEEPHEVFVPGYKEGTGPSKEVEEASPSTPTKLRIRMKTIWEDPRSSTKPKSFHAVEDRTSSGCDSASQGPLLMVGNIAQEMTKENEGSIRFGESNSQIDNISRISVLRVSKKPHEESNNRMYNAVYKRSKPFRSRAITENDGVDIEESTSNASNNNADPRIDFPDTTADGVRRTRSMAMKATTREPYNDFKVREGHRSVEASTSGEKFPCEQLLGDNWGFAKVRGGLRSVRNRRENYSDNNLTPLSKRNSHKSFKKLSWLMLSEHEENYRYIPQLGDEVAYLRQGHEGYIEWRHHRSKEKGPWTKFEGLRAVEFCKVDELEYSTFTGSGESCCKVTLKFLDRSSSGFDRTFKLTLPELNDYSDFLVERTRYDASMNRNWTKRDKCQVWWRNDNEEGGSWYDGRIVAVQPRSLDFPDSPWERYAIQYKSDADQHLHSPWELHEPDTPWFHPSIEEEMRKKLLSSLGKLEQHGIRNKDRYGIQKLEQASQKSDFLNRFAVPLTFEVIQSRLDHNYYRSLEAVKHDFTVMLENAQIYFVKNEELKVKLRRLSDWFNEKLLPLESLSNL
ncbi:Bromodomain and wd repeat-containing protein [Thalictrum thalictroides]|uniref:Bromodomain and wd repeat-containing protein n=1 Tax=Thalictrum thalictroides TaxID=46969 RepID=A0A7J6W4I8_THATH|nr:Bromodomain and wd repeat-containing protein [Thalictrum thalictroides]